MLVAEDAVATNLHGWFVMRFNHKLIFWKIRSLLDSWLYVLRLFMWLVSLASGWDYVEVTLRCLIHFHGLRPKAPGLLIQDQLWVYCLETSLTLTILQARLSAFCGLSALEVIARSAETSESVSSLTSTGATSISGQA
jgi:hypothetical protein